MPLIRRIATVNLNAISCTVKKFLLRDFIWNNDLDVVFLQEVAFENFSFIRSHKAIVNISEDGKGTGVLLRTNIDYSNCVLNSNGRITSVCIDNINFINIYAHSGSKFKKERDLLFTQDILIHLAIGKENLLLGDFNCIVNPDDSNSTVKNISIGLKSLISSLNLLDVDKKFHGKNARFTFYRSGSKSRLDRIYSSDTFMRCISNVTTMPLAFSDHHGVTLTYNVDNRLLFNFLGRGYWKLNSFLLNNDDINNRFVSMYNNLKTRNSALDLNYWWNNDFKNSAKRFYKTESFRINQQSTREKSFYYQCLKELFDKQQNGEETFSEMAIVKSKLMQLENTRMNAISYKFKPNTLLSEEKLGLFQISTSINRCSATNILKLRVNGNLTSETSILKETLFKHFKQKFEKSPDTDTDYENVLSYLRNKLDQNDQQSLMDPISVDELKTALIHASKRSSPGLDGLCYEFYSVHFDLLKDDLVNLFNSYLIGGNYPPASFSAGVVTLIPKKGDSYDLDNRRPISMLNSDYKLFAKILWNRLQPMMVKLVGSGQSACITNQSCVENLRTLRNVLIKGNTSKHFKAMILSLDLEKAFDRVDHDFLWAVLEKFAFPAQIIGCLKRLYKNANSKILFNGFCTSSFAIRSSVRQGCPLSMALFVLYIEPLIRMLNENISGCLIDNSFVKLIVYADDINILIRNNHEFDTVLEIVGYFSIYSKIKLNVSKSQYLRINSCPSGPHLIKEVDTLHILGLHINPNFEKLTTLNYNKYINEIKHLLSLHNRRNLNLFQKVWTLNTYIFSKLWYICQVFPPNNKQIATLKSISGRFLWQGYIFKVPRNELYLPVYKGGLGLVDIESKSKALFVKNILFSPKNNRLNNDTFMLNQHNNRHLTRNMKEWITLANEIKSNASLDTSKKIYDFIIEGLNISCKTQEDLPQLPWDSLLNNLNSNFITSRGKTIIFCLMKDIVPYKKKMFVNNIRGTSSSNCGVCNNEETLRHIIKQCILSCKIWTWLKHVLTSKMKLKISDPDEILCRNITNRNYKNKAALWLVIETISFNIETKGLGSLEELQQRIRIARFNSKGIFRRQFRNFLDIF